MKVLAISGRFRDAAAAVAVDGRLVAAVSQDSLTRVAGQGYADKAGFPVQAVETCLETSGIAAADIDRATIVEREVADDRAGGAPDGCWFEALSGRARAGESIDAVHADALQAAASSEAKAVLVCGAEPPTMAEFVRSRGSLTAERTSDGTGLLSAARLLAAEVGADAADPFRAIDRLSVGGDPEFQPELADAVRWGDDTGVEVDLGRLRAIVAAVASGAPSGLADAASLNVRAQQIRRALAASFTCRVAEVVRDAADSLRARSGADQVAFGGAMFGNSRLTTELRQLLGDDMSVAAVPETAGRALGAALAISGGADAARLPGLALGPAFSDDAIKRTLDNCRLEYLYEPDWPRLLRRVSRMLAQGKVVAWFQGGMGFGPRPTGTRSVLCDPSSRYARPNVNEYLRHVPLDEPLPMVFAPSNAGDCLSRPALRPLAVVDAEVRADWRDKLAGALDWRQYVRVHDISPAQSPALCDLLDHHLADTGVPGLIETNLGAVGEPPACTPRDAIRTFYSSAIDALVIGRFVLMKDHWLLRTDGD